MFFIENLVWLQKNVYFVEDQANNTRQCKTERCIEQER